MFSKRVEPTSTDELTVFQAATPLTADRPFSTLFALSMDAVFLVDTQGRILDANPAATDLLQLLPDACVGRSLLDFIEPASASAHTWQTLQQQSEGSWQFIRTDKARLTVNYRLTNTFAPGCSMVILRDMTEQNQLQQQVQQQQKYQTLFEILPIGVCITDAAGQIVEANSASEQILGISTTEQTQRTLDAATWQLVHPDGTPMAASDCASVRALRENRVIEGEEKGIVQPDGSIHWLRVSAAPIPIDNYGVAIAYIDITAQKQIETVLRENTAYYQSLTAVMPLALFRKDCQGRLTFLNQACLNTLGQPLSAVLGKTVHDFYPPELAAQYDADDRAVLETGEILQRIEAHQAPTQREPSYVQVLKAPVRDQDGTIIGTQGIYWDMTDRITLETALRDSEAKLQAILQSAIAAIYSFVIDAQENWHYTYFSPGCETIFGYSPEELLADRHLLFSRIPAEETSQWLQASTPAIFAGATSQFEFRFQHQDGSVRWLRATVYPQEEVNQDGRNVTVVAVDISDLKATEQALRQSEKTTQAIVEAIPDLLIQMHRDGTYLQIHRSLDIQLINPDQVQPGNTIWDVLPNPMATERMHYIQQALATNTLQVYEYEFAIAQEIYYEEARIVPMGEEQVLLLVRNIGQRKVAELALRQREEEFRTLAEHSPYGIIRLDQAYRFIYVNPTVTQQTGMPAIAFLGKTVSELSFPEQMLQIWQSAIAEVFATAQELELETPATLITGTKILSSRIVPEHSDTGAVESVLIVSRDITELKQAQDELLHQTQRERMVSTITQQVRQSLDLTDILHTAVGQMRLLLNADRALIYRFNADGSGDMIAESVCAPWISVLGSTLYDPCFTGALVTAYQQGKVHQIEDLHTYPGEPCYAELLASFQIRANLVMPISDGAILWGLFCIHHCAAPHVWQSWEVDALQRLVDQLAIAIQQSELYQQVRQLNVMLEQQVQERTADLQQALELEMLLKRITDQVRDSLDEAVILETVVRELAEGLELELCDTGVYDAERTTSTIVHEYTRPPHASAKGKSFAIADAENVDVYPALFRGEPVQFSNFNPFSLRETQDYLTVLACPIWDGQTMLGDLWLFRQTSEIFSDLEVRLVQQVANQCAIALRQSRLYRAAENQVVELERLNHLKDDFLSTVSHELRTPMSNIKMATELLEIYLTQQKILSTDFALTPRKQTTSPIERYFQILKDEGKREISLINDLLDLARIDAQTEPLLLSTIDLTIWIPSQVESFVTRTQQQQQSLILRLPANLPPLTTDTAHLQRIMQELLNNACKYTPPGETIRIAARALTAHNVMELEIANSGVSLSALECDRIFDRFYRIPNNDPWKHGGTGLGLALVKKLVEYMQGTIWAESKAKHLQFVIRLPLQLEPLSPP